MNHTITKTLSIALALIVIILGYLHEIKAEAKTYSLSTSMSTACNGETDKPCQTIECKNDKSCRTIDSNSDQTDITSICKNNQPCSNTSPNSIEEEEDDNNDITTPLEAP